MDPSLFKAMSHPIRVGILGDLSIPNATLAPSEFAEKIRKKLTTVSYHFRVLEKYGLIEIVKEKKSRGSVKHVYRSKALALFTNSKEWESMLGQARTEVAAQTWRNYLEVSRRAIDAGAFEKRADSNFSWGTMTLDEQGWVDMQASLARTLADMFRIKDEADKRMGASGEEGFDATYGMGAFESPPVKPDDDEEDDQ
jgi:DNA-binding transcriptional ArsR family regulator